MRVQVPPCPLLHTKPDKESHDVWKDLPFCWPQSVALVARVVMLKRLVLIEYQSDRRCVAGAAKEWRPEQRNSKGASETRHLHYGMSFGGYRRIDAINASAIKEG